MIHSAAIAGLLVGLLRGGKIRNLGMHHLKLIPALIISFLLEAAVVSGLIMRFVGAGTLNDKLRLFASILQYLLVILFLLVNAHWLIRPYARLALYLVSVGSAANAIVIAANWGQMPVSLMLADRFEFMQNAPVEKIISAHHYVLATDTTIFVLLGDWLPFWSFGWYMVSPGDLFISAGLAMFVFWLTQTSEKQNAKNLEQPENIVYTNGR